MCVNEFWKWRETRITHSWPLIWIDELAFGVYVLCRANQKFHLDFLHRYAIGFWGFFSTAKSAQNYILFWKFCLLFFVHQLLVFWVAEHARTAMVFWRMGVVSPVCCVCMCLSVHSNNWDTSLDEITRSAVDFVSFPILKWTKFSLDPDIVPKVALLYPQVQIDVHSMCDLMSIRCGFQFNRLLSQKNEFNPFLLVRVIWDAGSWTTHRFEYLLHNRRLGIFIM